MVRRFIAPDDLVDDLVAETPLREIGVDLPPSHGGLEIAPTRRRPGDGAQRALGLRVGRELAQGDVDGLARDALHRELGDEGSVAFRPELRALLDPVLGEVEVVDIPLRAELVDGPVDRLVVVPLPAKVPADLADAPRSGREVPDGGLVGAAERMLGTDDGSLVRGCVHARRSWHPPVFHRRTGHVRRSNSSLR